MDYREKVVIITGGVGGIGKVLSYEYAKLGATVVFADIVKEAGGKLAKAWQDENLKVEYYQIDLREVAAIRHMFAQVVERYGKVDILINNAGKSYFKPLLELTADEWNDVIEVNLRAAFISAQEFMKYHREETYGRIIQIASTRYLMSEPHSEAYAASKGGLVSLTHALALSVSDKFLTVNALSPGWIENNDYAALKRQDHEQHPVKRVGKPQDIFRACLFLTDEANDFITGQNLVIDGGMTKKMIYWEANSE